MKARKKQEGGDHYVNLSVQPWDVIDSWPLEQQVGYYRGNALKYLMRAGTKDERGQEIRKAMHYLEKLIETLEGVKNDAESGNLEMPETRELSDCDRSPETLWVLSARGKNQRPTRSRASDPDGN